jgi:5'-3' exonuclease
MSNIMIIDGLNMFFRAYMMDPSLAPNGQPTGGIKGTFKMLQKLIRENNPDKIYFAWDGPKSAIRRRAVNSNYKEGRKPIRLNRNFGDLTEEDEKKNKYWQYARVVEYLNQMPIAQIYLDFIEADDVISVLVRELKNDNKIIVSNDKDFLQLLDETTTLYRPCKEEIYNVEKVVNEFDIHPTNFALARAVVGDASDNLPGAKGVGLKTMAKKFPQLKEEKSVLLTEIFDSCKNEPKPLMVHNSILESEKVIKDNYDMMQLYAPSLSIDAREKIRDIIDNYPASFNKTNLRKMMMEDGTGNFSWTELFANLNMISITSKVKNESE